MRASLVALILAATPVASEPVLEQLSVYVWERPERYFGGWSAIEVAKGGMTFTAIGDNAQSYYGTFQRDGDRITGVSRGPVGALTDIDGVAFFRKGTEELNDSEGLAVFPDGRFAVSFERTSRIIVYDEDALPVRIELPREVNGLAENGGVEALAIDGEGRLIAIPETVPKDAPGFPVWRQDGNGWETVGHLKRTQGFRPVGADVGPDGRLYVLERAFRLIGFQSRIRAFELDAFAPEGALLWVASMLAFDNLEGLSVWEDAGGALRFTMISDDNYLSVQRTEIVEFRLTQ